jgi:hypothetical protein
MSCKQINVQDDVQQGNVGAKSARHTILASVLVSVIVVLGNLHIELAEDHFVKFGKDCGLADFAILLEAALDHVEHAVHVLGQLHFISLQN